MKRALVPILTFTFSSAFVVAGCTSTPKTSAPASPAAGPALTIDGFAAPESVLGVGDARFVSNIGDTLQPLAKDGDGFISRLDDTGKVLERHFYPAGDDRLDAPKGMAAIGGTLFVADIDRVVGIDIGTRKKTFEAKLPGGAPALLNDIDVATDAALVVSDTARNCIYRLTLADRTFTVIARDIEGANGLAIDHDTGVLYAVGLGSALAGGTTPGRLFILLPNGRLTSPTAFSGLFDGVARLPDGTILVSDWVAIAHPAAGRLRVIDRDGVEDRSIDLPFEAHGPADFWIDHAHRRIWIPRSLDNSVSVVELPVRRNPPGQLVTGGRSDTGR